MIKLIFAGDFIPPDFRGDIYSDSLLNILRDKDFSIVNLEAPITASSLKIKKTGRNFKIPIQGIPTIKTGLFDAAALANNHIRDFGNKGVKDTLEFLNDHKILYVGAGKNIHEASNPLRIELKGVKISILNYCETEFNIATSGQAGANPYYSINAFYEIKKEKLSCDYLIVIYHGGYEYCYYPTPDVVKRFKFMADTGADAVICHHTHRYSGRIDYNGKLLFFGLGNFLAPTIARSDIDDWRTGLVVKLMIKNSHLQSELFPVRMSPDYKRVELLNGLEKQKILNHVQEISDNIENEEYLENFWQRESAVAAVRVLNIINSRSRTEYRLRKIMPLLSRFFSSKYRLLNLLGMIQNDSNRLLLTESMKKILFEKK